MSTTVDDEIINMKINNSSFLQGVAAVINSIAKLKSSMTFGKETQSLNNLQAAGSRFNMGGMGAAVDGISGKFLAMSTIAVTAISRVTNAAINAGTNMVKSLAVTPLTEGFKEYELKMGSIQTILANTARYGTKLPEVTKKLDELNHYADKTIYNFGDMTKNIGLFTNAGIRIGDATSMIKGFSNEAAASGTNAQGAASAAYQLSQALSAGTIRLMDWRSLQNVGMGNKNMQQGLVDLAASMGTLDKAGTSSKEVMSDFNGSLEKKWLSADVMSKYLKIMAGDMDVAQMKQLGLTDAQIKGFQAQQKMSEEAATKVRTFTQLMGTIKESIGSGWAETFGIVFGDFNKATDLFTGINDVVGGALGKMAAKRNEVLKGWAKGGGREALLEGLGNVFKALGSVLKPIKDAFREIFPAKTSQDLIELSEKFRDFTEKLKVSSETADKIKRTFAGVFAVFSIIGHVVGSVIGVFTDLIGIFVGGGGAGGILSFTAGIGDMLVKLDDAIKKGGLLNGFFTTLTAVLALPIKGISALGKLIVGLMDGFDKADLSGFTNMFGDMTTKVGNANRVGERMKQLWGGISDVFKRVADFLRPIGEAIVDAFGSIGEKITQALNTAGFDGIADVLNAVLIGGILYILKKFKDDGLSITADIGGGSGFVGTIKDTFGQLTDTLSAMQTQIQAKTLMLIAGAIALLTASVVALSLIDSEALKKALIAMAAGFGQLMVAMGILIKMSASAGIVKIPAMAAAMVLMAGAILILSAAMTVMSKLSWEEIAKGLVGVAGAMLVLVGGTAALSAMSGGILRAGLAMIPLATGILILSGAVKVFATMKWDEIGRGLVAMAGSLGIVAGAMRLMPPGLAATGLGLALVGVGIKLMASALTKMGEMSWGELIKGLIGLAGGLAIIAIATNSMEAALPGAAALLVAAMGLGMVASAMERMGSLSGDELAKGLIGLGGALAIIAIGVNAMTGAIAGAAALLVVSAALAVLAPVLVVLGAMEWSAIGKGLAVLAGALLVLGVGGAMMTAAVPGLLGLGAALLLVGAGMALAGAGALAFATAFGIFIGAGYAGLTLVKAYLTQMVTMLPDILTALVKALVQFVIEVGKAAPKMIDAFAKILISMLDAVIKVAPKLGAALEVMLNTGIGILERNAPHWARAGLDLIIAFLSAVRSRIGRITEIVVDIVVRFINKLADQQDRVINAGVRFIIKFLNGLSKAIDDNSEKVGRAAGRLGASIVRGMISGIGGLAGELNDAAWNMAKGALSAIHDAILNPPFPSREGMKLGASLGYGFAYGIRDSQSVSDREARNIAENTMDTLKYTLRGLSSGIEETINLNPTVTPVLDLAQLTQDANKISGLMPTDKLAPTISFMAAADISNTRQDDEDNAPGPDDPPAPISFTQINNSPKALDPIEVYRNTKNQFSLAKEALEK